MPRYTGTVLKVSTKKDYAWIGRKSVVDSDGNSVTLDTNKDIYLHRNDCATELHVGMVVMFDICNDRTRPNAFRADSVVETMESRLAYQKANGIDLHILDTVIDNPGVRARWCVKSEMHAHILEGLRAGNGYAVLLVMRRKERDDQGFHEVREVYDWQQSFTIMTFPKPGDWQVNIFLFERKNQGDGQDTTHALKLALRNTFLERTRISSRYERHIGPVSDIQFGENHNGHGLLVSGLSRYHDAPGKAISVGTVDVSVPNDIFAPEPSAAVKTFGNYFFRGRSPDQCDLRRRLLIMIPGAIPWALLEVGKRMLNMLLSILFMLFCMKGSFKLFLGTFSPAIDYRLSTVTVWNRMGLDDYENPTLVGIWKGRYGLYYTPMAFVVYIALLMIGGIILPLLFQILGWVFGFFGRHLGEVFAFIMVIGFFFGSPIISGVIEALSGKSREERHEERQQARTLRIAARQAALAARKETVLVCGDAPATVTLEAVPAELQTIGTWFRSIKREVCRPFV